MAKRTVTLKGKPLTLAGNELKAGSKAPDFKMVDIEWIDVRLSDSKG